MRGNKEGTGNKERGCATKKGGGVVGVLPNPGVRSTSVGGDGLNLCNENTRGRDGAVGGRKGV